MSGKKKWLIGILSVLVALLLAIYVIYGGGEHEGPGFVHTAQSPAATVAARGAAQVAAEAGFPESERADGQILFGDLHVHTTFSTDAFLMSLPLLGGEGAHPPADACDFARYCSALDFFALTDHAEALTQAHWEESKASIRQCEAVAGGRAAPDLVPFMGFEWTQVGATPDAHYGHKNVIFQGLGEADLPVRPIGAEGLANQAMRGGGIDPGLVADFAAVPVRDFSRRQRYLDLGRMQREISGAPRCPEGVDTRELPADCMEVAETPRALFDKLDQWSLDALVIPHGTTWGFYTPPGYTWDKQLAAEQDDPARQRLLEVYSGHGNSEEYRSWRAVEIDKDGVARCPAPTPGYEPCCWRAGEIIRSRCGEASASECESRVAEARERHIALGVAGFRAIPGASVEDWRGCDQCRDCYGPSFNYRPGGSAQYILARGNFDDPARPRHAVLGLMASSDNHKARPGTGYKEFARRKMTEATGPEAEEWAELVYGEREAPSLRAAELDPGSMAPFRAVFAERQASFFMTGGLVAVHSQGRNRAAIWDALKRREVYGTSGDRILLWFDLINGPEGSRAMGSEVQMGASPRFVVRAAGAFEQEPGCPDWVKDALGGDALARLCVGECYNPSDTRRRIVRIEVIRIRPQRAEEEPIDGLIEDVWRSFDCPDDPAGCRVEFDDPAFLEGARDVVYYVRAIQEATPTVNAGNLRCEGEGCETQRPCFGGVPTPLDDDCLADAEERAWSSPIFVRFDPRAAPADPPAPSDAPQDSPSEGQQPKGQQPKGQQPSDPRPSAQEPKP